MYIISSFSQNLIQLKLTFLSVYFNIELFTFNHFKFDCIKSVLSLINCKTSLNCVQSIKYNGC